MSMSWPDRYRPDDLKGMALTPELRDRFERYLSGSTLPHHLILHGPPGCGKTTIATIIADTLYANEGWPRVMRVKSGETGNVEYIRTTVIDGFMRGFGSKLVIFEEASGLSRESQEALRPPLEDWEDVVRVIFLTNHVDKLDRPVRDRCENIEMGRPPLDECIQLLERVLKAEEASFDPSTIPAFVRGHFAAASDEEPRTMRTLLRAAQHAIETDGRLPVPPETERAPSVEELWQGPPGEATDGGKLLDDLAAEFNKYLVLPEGGVEALTLWTVFAWAHEAFAISPILTLSSPTMRAGKSRVFEMLEQLVPSPLHPSNLTPAVVFRLRGLAEADQSTPSPTPKLPALCLLMDEADAWIKLGDDMRGILNSGHARRGAYVLRMIGGAVGKFSSWYPKAIALIDHASTPLPDTLRDRSIIVPMQRKHAGETRLKFQRQHDVPELVTLRETAARWARDNFATLRELYGGALLSADELNDRAKDNWQSLMAIAHAAGGGWEQRARRASVILSAAASETELLVDLLADIRNVFDAEGTDELRSVTLAEKLVALEGEQWKALRLNAIKLANRLRPLGIRPRQLWTPDKRNIKSYARAQFENDFARYLS